jgi:two-component SAPR family response regulator
LKIVIVDDEKIILDGIKRTILKIYPKYEINCFLDCNEAVNFINKFSCDVALLDIQMPEISGIELAKRIKGIKEDINIIFITGYSQYAVNAFSLNASGYIIKPPRDSDIINAFENLRHPIKENDKLFVQCFGNFEVFYKGTPVHFRRRKAKELFAYLVNKNGATCNINELCAVLWENSTNLEADKVYLRTLIAELNKVLISCNAGEVFIRNKQNYGVDKTKFECDFYEYLTNDTKSANLYMGEYMNQYSWAELTNAYLEQKKCEEA